MVMGYLQEVWVHTMGGTSGSNRYSHVGRTDRRQAQLIHDFKPTALMVTPSYCLNIIECLEKKFNTAKNTSIKTGIFWCRAMD